MKDGVLGFWGFGLSNVFWDRVFGTEQDSIKNKKK